MDVCLFAYVGMGFGIPKAPQDFIVGQRETFLMLLGVRPEQSTLNLEQSPLYSVSFYKKRFEMFTVSYIFHFSSFRFISLAWLFFKVFSIFTMIS